MDAANSLESSVLSTASLVRISLPWQSTALFFCPEISSGISKISSTSAFAGSCCGPCNSTPDWLMFWIRPSYQVLRFFPRYRTGSFDRRRRARGIQVGCFLLERRRTGVVSAIGSVPRFAAPQGVRTRHWLVDPISATHGLPVVLVSGRANQADLVVLSIGRAARPGKLVRTASQHKNVHEFLRHDDE